MNYRETISFLYDTLPMFSRLGSAAYKKDLHNTIELCKALGDPQKKFKCIHVAGTNGKGSVSHMLAAILQDSGYRTGLYTSPHLHDFRERIRINGIMVPEDFVTHFVEKHRSLIKKIEPSFFEITVALAFDYFAAQEVDIAVIEVGLGGRLDSTNVVDPLLSVITQIGMDHMNLLGNTLEEIAWEKAGIIKQDRPVVIGEWLPETRPVFEKMAAEKNAAILFASDVFAEAEHHFENDQLEVCYIKNDGSQVTVRTDLSGIYQVKNVRTVLAACELFPQLGLHYSREVMLRSLSHVKKTTGLLGRWDIIHHEPLIVLEVAHNEDGIRQMLQHLEETSYENLHLVMGMVRDKDVDSVLRLLPAGTDYYFTQASIPRALDAEALREKAAAYGLAGRTYPDVNAALLAAKTRAGKKDLVIVCGSIFLVAEVQTSSVFQLA